MFVGCLQRRGGHESRPAAAAAVLRSVGAEGAPRNWRLRQRHKVAKQGTDPCRRGVVLISSFEDTAIIINRFYQ